ncbi:hypothetical protein BGX30_002143, partial [Mortierella sp. GBA39]
LPFGVIFVKLKNSAKRALHPSTKDDHSVVNAIAAVHVEISRILNRAGHFAPDGPIINDQGEDLGSHNGSQGGSKNFSATPRDQGPNSFASRDAPVQSDSSSPTTTPSEETRNTDRSSAAGSVLPNSVAQKVPTRQTIFSQNVAKPVFRVALPKVGLRFTSTLQLAFGQHLLSKNPLPSAPISGLLVTSGNYVQMMVLDEAEEAWKNAVEKDSAEQDHVRWLTAQVATEFINCPNKDAESIAEVVLLGSAFDRKVYHRVVSSLVGQLGREGLLDIDLLLGLMQLILEASPGHLTDDDLVRILRILREQLTKTYKALGDAEHAASDHIYLLSTIISRVLDVMMEGNTKGLNRAEDHKPLLDLLVELKGTLDPYLKFQASYAWQALQYAGDDEPPLHAILRIGGGVTMAALSAASVFKFDPENLFKGLDTLAQAAGQAFDVVKAGVEGAQALRKGGEGAMDSLLKGFRSGSKRAWYPALQAARICVREGRLADFQQIIYEAPCRRESEFQWGVCQLLGEIAMDPIWAIENRQQAVELLGELYKSDKGWIPNAGVKKAILGILHRISTNAEPIIHGHVEVVLQDPAIGCAGDNSRSYPLKSRLPLPAMFPLLSRVQALPAVEFKIHRLISTRLKGDGQSVYIPPHAKANLQASDKDAFPLIDKVEDFLSSSRQVFLVLGDSGAGKSKFNRHLEQKLLDVYKHGDPIPLFINLPTIDRPQQKMIDKQLENHDFSKEEIQELKEHRRRFIIICDGYDETQLKVVNLHTTNLLNQEGQWDTKMIISCRSTYLGSDYKEIFRPMQGDRYASALSDLYAEAAIVPFSPAQIKNYVQQYVQEPGVYVLFGARPIWSAKMYMDILEAIPKLMELVKNPFLLTLSLKTLPTVVKDSPDLTKLKVTRLSIYHAFIEQWADLGRLRLMQMFEHFETEKKEVLGGLIEDGFQQAVVEFLKNLAAAIFREQDGNPTVDYTYGRDRGSWKGEFFGNQPEPTFLRESSPLARVGTQHQFIHRSLLEYFYSRHIFDAEAPRDIARHPLSQRNLVKEPSIVQFLAESVHDDLSFKRKLFRTIEQSKTDNQASQAAANAITILVRAGVLFNGADLKGIQIPGADLSGGQFDSAQLQGADLTDVILSRSWLRQADLSGTRLEGVRFGELPWLY